MQKILEWCASIVGPCEIVSGDHRFHGRTAVCRLQTRAGGCYLKLHRQRPFWEREVHGYERWAAAFGPFAPPLLGVHEARREPAERDAPLALLVGELPGVVMEQAQLSARQERRVWRAAGRALADLHALAHGDCFGPCGRDGTPVNTCSDDAVAYVTAEIQQQADEGTRAGYLTAEELTIVQSALSLAPAFAGERPVPCHRDYGPANWLVSAGGDWAGVIDFEFAHWDVRVADFSRYPDWEWTHRPDLLEALFDGYGRPLTLREEGQLIVTRTRYALGAIVWGHAHAFHGFAQEGRQALKHIAGLLG